jgi:hypothetical protein
MSSALGLAVRTQQEVAEIMTARGYPMGASAVWWTERRALQKIKILLSSTAKDLGYGDQREGGVS